MVLFRFYFHETFWQKFLLEQLSSLLNAVGEDWLVYYRSLNSIITKLEKLRVNSRLLAVSNELDFSLIGEYHIDQTLPRHQPRPVTP